MAFYDLNGNQLTIQQFIKYYEQYYFINTPNIDKRITRRNKTNPFVENLIENILQRGIQPQDIVFVIAWKIGAIDHASSNTSIVYKQNFDRTLRFKTQYNVIDVNVLVHYILNNFANLINQNNPAVLLQDLLNNRGNKSYFGLVYCIALIYFFSQGQYPIYDRFTHIAINAYTGNKMPKTKIACGGINSWQDYLKYFVQPVKSIFQCQAIPRAIDRSLWVYGHFF